MPSSDEENKDFWRKKYENAENLVEFIVRNNSGKVKYVWIEPAAISIELDAKFRYKILSHDRFFTIEYTSEDSITFWMNNSFGFILYKRAINAPDYNTNWELELDTSDIQFPKASK